MVTPMSRKIGRNSLCPCGSGRKYKRCCLRADEESARTRVEDRAGGAGLDALMQEASDRLFELVAGDSGWRGVWFDADDFLTLDPEAPIDALATGAWARGALECLRSMRPPAEPASAMAWALARGELEDLIAGELDPADALVVVAVEEAMVNRANGVLDGLGSVAEQVIELLGGGEAARDLALTDVAELATTVQDALVRDGLSQDDPIVDALLSQLGDRLEASMRDDLISERAVLPFALVDVAPVIPLINELRSHSGSDAELVSGAERDTIARRVLAASEQACSPEALEHCRRALAAASPPDPLAGQILTMIEHGSPEVRWWALVCRACHLLDDGTREERRFVRAVLGAGGPLHTHAVDACVRYARHLRAESRDPEAVRLLAHAGRDTRAPGPPPSQIPLFAP